MFFFSKADPIGHKPFKNQNRAILEQSEINARYLSHRNTCVKGSLSLTGTSSSGIRDFFLVALFAPLC